MGLKTLDEIAIGHQTDKATVFDRTYAKPKGYTVHYEKFFEPLRHQEIKLIEIGVAGGESIRTWLDYFKNAHIWGIDNVQDTNIFNMVGKPFDRYTFIHADQSDATMWKCLAVDSGSDWDVVIDDGSHRIDHIIASFDNGWPYLRSGGYWCVEDLGVGYGEGSVFLVPGKPTHSEWIKSLIDKVNQGQGDVASIHCFRELVVIQKQYPCTNFTPIAVPAVLANHPSPR